MEPFNLQQALDGSSVILKNGMTVSNISGPTQNVISATIDALDLRQLWYSDGKFYRNQSHPMDLFMK